MGNVSAGRKVRDHGGVRTAKGDPRLSGVRAGREVMVSPDAGAPNDLHKHFEHPGNTVRVQQTSQLSEWLAGWVDLEQLDVIAEVVPIKWVEPAQVVRTTRLWSRPRQFLPPPRIYISTVSWIS